MRCPFCGNEDTQVKDSRPTDDNAAIRRRRQCPNCGARFTTFERVQLRELTVVKTTGQREPFDRDKLMRSMQISLRKRPVDSDRLERVVNGIVRRLESSGESEIPLGLIAVGLVPARLRNVSGGVTFVVTMDGGCVLLRSCAADNEGRNIFRGVLVPLA